MIRLARSLAVVTVAVVASGCGTTQPYAGMTAGELFGLAVQEYDEGDWDDAIDALEQLFLSFAGFSGAAEARMMLGNANFQKGDYLTAQAEYTRFLDRYAAHPDAGQAALGVCRSLAALSPIPQRDQTYTQDAQSVCRNVVLDYAGTPEAQAAAAIANEMRLKLAEKDFLNGEHYSRRGLHDSAIKYYQFVVDLYPDTEWAPRALLGIVRSNEEIGYDDLAEQARRQLLRDYPDSPEAAQARAPSPGG